MAILGEIKTSLVGPNVHECLSGLEFEVRDREISSVVGVCVKHDPKY